MLLPSLTADLTASIATLPPPMTTVFLPSSLSPLPRPISLKNLTAETIFLLSSPSSPNFLSVEAPIVISVASYILLSSLKSISTPILKPYLTSTPVFNIASISSSNLSFGRR